MSLIFYRLMSVRYRNSLALRYKASRNVSNARMPQGVKSAIGKFCLTVFDLQWLLNWTSSIRQGGGDEPVSFSHIFSAETEQPNIELTSSHHVWYNLDSDFSFSGRISSLQKHISDEQQSALLLGPECTLRLSDGQRPAFEGIIPFIRDRLEESGVCILSKPAGFLLLRRSELLAPYSRIPALSTRVSLNHYKLKRIHGKE
jgi:hypothetical protein